MGAFGSRQQSSRTQQSSTTTTTTPRTVIRDSTRESINTNNHEPVDEDNIFDLNRHSHSQAETADTVSTEDWNQVQERFRSQLLDETFTIQPIRGSTIEAADQYPATSTKDQNYLMPGTHKHLGGAYDPEDGCIYGVPANSKSVLCLYPKVTTDENGVETKEYLMKVIPLPRDIQEVRMKWLRGIFAHGYLWAIPSWAPKVLCVDIAAYWGRREESPEGIVQLLDLPEDHPKDQIWQWHGAGINHEKTAIYCIPANAHQVLKVDLATKSTSLIPVKIDRGKYPDLDVETVNNKWYVVLGLRIFLLLVVVGVGKLLNLTADSFARIYPGTAVLLVPTMPSMVSLTAPVRSCGLIAIQTVPRSLDPIMVLVNTTGTEVFALMGKSMHTPVTPIRCW